MVTTRVPLDEVWTWLSEVPDPEIPAISIVDLGIIRDVAWQGETLQVTVTPTYSGCPATSVINMEIETALRAKGIDDITLKRQIAPPWTTDWLSDTGRAKLEAYGIAPPRPAGGPDRCPRCHATDPERCLLYTSPSPRDQRGSRMPSSA